MHLDDTTFTRNGKTYRRVLIRQSFREGKKVKSKTIANISNLPNHEIEAIKIAFKFKNDLEFLKKFAGNVLKYDKIVGPSLLLKEAASQLAIPKILGSDSQAKYALWMIFARLIEAGSRLAAVRLANDHYGCELLEIDQINENMLYQTLEWLHENQSLIEGNLYKQWKKEHPGEQAHIFLYDVSSSYLEGDQNQLGSYGYNRDRKQGKKQIVYGLLTDGHGNPLAIEAFKGNTADPKTFEAQLQKIKQIYQCKYVTIVGDKGMLNNIELERLNQENYRFITSISKPQIEGMLKKGVIQLELFADELCEIGYDNVRYILRRNPYRAKEVSDNRISKTDAIAEKVKKANEYLQAHPKAKTEVQYKKITTYIGRLKLSRAITLGIDGPSGSLIMQSDADALRELAKLDGCYVIKTNVEKESLTTEQVHDQYKELATVEWAFRITKSCLEIRPIYLRNENRTRGHLLVCLLAYKIEKYLREKWSSMNITVTEALNSLSKITAISTSIGEAHILRILKPDDYSQQLLDKLNIKLPNSLPKRPVNVVTYKTLTSERK